MTKYLILFSLITIIGCKSKEEEDQESLYEPPSVSGTAQNQEIAENISRGSAIYNNFCVTCHLSSGEGIPGVFPPLNGSDWLSEKRTAAIHAVKFGLQGPIEVNGKAYNSVMTDLGLTDQEIADVLNYVFQAWDNNIEKPVTLEEVQAVKE